MLILWYLFCAQPGATLCVAPRLILLSKVKPHCVSAVSLPNLSWLPCSGNGKTVEVGSGLCPLFPYFCWYCASLFLPKAQGGIRCSSQEGSWWQERRVIVCGSCPTKEHEGREDEQANIFEGTTRKRPLGKVQSFSKVRLAGRRGISDRTETMLCFWRPLTFLCTV